MSVEAIGRFFEQRQEHSFLVLFWAKDVVYLFMDMDADSRPYVVISKDGCAQYPYRGDAERDFLKKKERNEPIGMDGGFDVVYVDRDSEDSNFDFGISYVAFLDEAASDCLLVFNKWGERCRCFRSRFYIPGVIKFYEMMKGE